MRLKLIQIENDIKNLNKQIHNIRSEKKKINSKIDKNSDAMKKLINSDDKCENFKETQRKEFIIRERHIRGNN